MNNAVEVTELSKEFEINTEYENLLKRLFNKKKEKVCAVNEVSFMIPQGEMVALLGKNGAGKSTLIKILTGIINPSKGEVMVAGYIPYKQRYKYSYHIGVVMGQKSLLWHNIPVKESLNLYKTIYGVSDKDYEKRIDFFRGLFDIDRLFEVPVRKLSLGERMKFEIVAALINEPEVLFLDEPTIGLDLLAKKQLYSFLREINAIKNTTIILTTHNVEDVENLCERVILMDKGKIIFDGKIVELCKRTELKTIVITGDVKLDDDMRIYLESQEGNRFVFKCNKDDTELVANIMSRVVSGSDISIIGTELEDILLQVYKGEVII